MRKVLVKMRLRKNQLKFIKGVLGCLGDEVLLRFSPEGLEVYMVDPAHVMMVHLTLSEKKMNALFLDEYVCSEPHCLGMDLNNISPKLLNCEGNEYLLEFDDEGHIDIEGRLSKVTIDEYLEFLMVNRRFNQISTEGMSNPKWPAMNYIGHFTTSGGHFFKVMRMLEEVSDHVAILATPHDGAAITADDDIGLLQAIGMSSKAVVDGSNGDEESNVRSLFPADYMKNLAVALKDCPAVTFDMHNDMPVRLTTELAGVKVEYLLAPRIESD